MNVFNKISFWAKKNSPEILLTTGIVSAAAAIVLACMATPKAEKVVTETKTQIVDIHTQIESTHYTEGVGKTHLRKLYTKSGLKLAALYAPAVLTFSLSVASMIGSHNILRGRNAALAAAFTTIKSGYDAYRERVKEKIGEKAENAIYENRTETIVKEKDENGKTITKKISVPHADKDSDFSLLFDQTCVGWEKDSRLTLTFLLQNEQYCNEKLRAQGYLFLSDVYDSLGVTSGVVGKRKLQGSHVLGWIYDPNDKSRDNYVSFGLHDANGKLTEQAKLLQDYQEHYVYLNFNVDGDILTGDNNQKTFMDVAVRKE